MGDRRRLYGAVSLAKFRALYDLIHCQVRWHLAKVALAKSMLVQQINPLAMLRIGLIHIASAQGRSLPHLGVDKIVCCPPPTPPAQNNNKFRDSDPARQVRYEPKREASVESAQVRINSALLLSRLYVWVDIMASRVVEELVAGEVPT